MAILHRSILEHVLVALFGSSAWLSINAVWMSMPLLVSMLPEQWTLPSYLALVIQISCIAPLLYAVVGKRCRRNIQLPSIVVMLLLITLTTFTLAFLYDVTSTVFSQHHSTALLIIFFFISCVSTTTNVVYLPYLARLRPQLITTFFSGMGLGALFPSLVSLVQGAGNSQCVNVTAADNTTSMQEHLLPPMFSLTVYYIIMAAWLAMTFCAFLALLSMTRQDKKEDKPTTEEHPLNEGETEVAEGETQVGQGSSTKTYICILLCTSWVCAMQNAVLPSLQVYACLPYGRTVYHLSLTLGNIANPIACLVPSFVHVKRTSWHVLSTAICTALLLYIVYISSQSPTPPFVDSWGGGVLTVIINVILAACLAYARTSMAQTVRGVGEEANGEQRLFWLGVATQTGSFIGAVFVFLLVNVAHVFAIANTCSRI